MRLKGPSTWPICIRLHRLETALGISHSRYGVRCLEAYDCCAPTWLCIHWRQRPLSHKQQRLGTAWRGRWLNKAALEKLLGRLTPKDTPQACHHRLPPPTPHFKRAVCGHGWTIYQIRVDCWVQRGLTNKTNNSAIRLVVIGLVGIESRAVLIVPMPLHPSTHNPVYVAVAPGEPPFLKCRLTQLWGGLLSDLCRWEGELSIGEIGSVVSCEVSSICGC